MNRRLLLLTLPLLILAAVVAIPWSVMPVHAAIGTVCLQDPSSVSNPATPCPASPPTFDGPVTTSTGPATQLRVGVYIQGSDAMNGFGVTLLSDHTILTPADADLTGTVLLTATPPGTPSIIVKCIGGILKAGSTCDSTTDSVDTIHFAAVAALGSITPSGVTGLLFTAVYNITGTAPAGGITIDYQTGCVNTSVSGFCVTITNGTQTPDSETTTNGTFDNSAFATSISWITIAVSPATIGPVTPTLSQTFTVTASAQNGWPTGQTDGVSFSFASTQGLSASFSAPSCLTGATSCSVSLIVAANNAPGDYTITAFGNFKTVDSVTTLTSTLASPFTVSIRIWDFGAAVNPSLLVVAPGGTATAVLNVTSLNRFPGVSAAVAISETSSPTGLLFTSTAAPNLTPNGFVLSTLTFRQPGAAPFPFASYSATVSVVVSGTTHTVVVPVKFGNFTISASPSPVSFPPGSTGSSTLRVQSNPAGDFLIAARPTNVAFLTTASATSTVTVTALNFSAPVALTVSASDPSVTATLSATSFATGSGSTTLTLHGTTAGSFSATVTATSGATSHSAVVTLTVTNPDFTITAPSTVVSVPVGTAGTLVLTIAAGNSFTGTVTFTNPPASTPAGLTCSLSVVSIVLGTSGTSTLSCTASVAHVYTVTVTATSGAITHTFIVNYIVPAIVAANNSLGFSGVVKLSNSISPSTGLTVTCATTSVTIGSGGSALDACTFSSSTPNTYLVTFTGTNNTRGGVVTTTFVLTVTVQPTGGFTVAANPTSVTVNANAAGTSTITATGTGSFTGTIALTASVSPSTGLSCLALSSITISAPLGSGTSTLSCNGASGNYMVTVTGTSTGFPTQTATVNYAVQDFSLSAPAITTLATVAGTSTVTVTPINGFSGTVTFSAGTVPAGCNASFTGAVLSVTCTTGVAPFSVAVTGTTGTGSSTLSRTTTVPVTVQDFSLSAPAITTLATVTGTSTVTVAPINGFTGTITFSAGTVPAACTASFASAVLSVTCGTGVAPFSVTVTGASSGLSRTTTVSVTVQDFSLSAPAITTVATVAGTSTVTVTPINGFTGTVSFSAGTVPAGCSASFTGAVLSVTCATGVAPFSVTITGTSGALSRTTTVLVTVQDFSLSAPAITTLATVAGTSMVTVTPINGFTGTVTFVAGTVPAACTASFTGAVLSVTCATGVSPFSVTVTGTSGSLSRTTTVPVTVQDFSLTANPASLSIVASVTSTSTITVNNINGFSGTVALALTSTAPTGCTVTLSGSVVSVNCSPVATFTVTVTGTSGSLSRTVNIQVSGGPDFTLTATPTSITSLATVAGTSTINVVPSGGFTGTVTFSAGAVPAGCTDSMTGAVLSVTCTTGVAPFSVTVTGTSVTPALVRTVNVPVTVQDFALSAPAITTLATVAGTSTVTVTPINGFSGTVTFSAGVPVGCTASFTGAVLSVTCDTGVAPFSVSVTGTSGGLSRTTTVPVTIQDFSLSAPAITILATVAGTSTVTVTPINGFAGTVTFSAGTMPAGCTASFSGAVLSVTCATGVAPFSVTVTGSSGGLSRTTTVPVTIQDFSLTANPTTITYTAPNTATSTITANAVNGFTGSIALTVTSTIPSGCTATVAPASVTLPTPNTSTLTAGCSTAINFSVTITGASGTLTHTVTIQVNGAAQLDFSITAGPVSPTQIFAGSSGTSTITVAALNGFTGTVNMAVSASSPSGLTCTLVGSVTIPPTATPALSCTAAAAGDYTVTVTGTSTTPALTHTTSAILFHVTDFALSASPTTITYTAPSTGTSTTSANAVNGFTGIIALTITSTTPAGCAATVSPASVTLPTPNTSTLTAGGCPAPGATFTVTVTGTSGSLTHTVDVQVTPNAPAFDFSLSTPSPSSLTVFQGSSSASSSIVATLVSGTTTAVTFSATGLPSGVTATFTNSPCNPTCTVTVSFSATATATIGTATVTISASGGGASHSTSIALTVATVAPRTTTTTITCTPASINFGSVTTCTALVNDTDTGTGIIPTGTVMFSSSGAGTFTGSPCTISRPAGVVVPIATCQVTYSPTGATARTDLITGNYSGDASHVASSGTFSVNVAVVPPDTTTTTVSCSPNSVTIGQLSSCTANVADTSTTPTTPTGTVSFVSDSGGSFSSSGSCALSATATGAASCTVNYTPNSIGSGTHTLTGSYSGDPTHATSTGSFQLTVTQPSGQAVQLTFRAFDIDDFDNGIGQLQVLVNGHLVVDLPAGLNHLTGSGDYQPYDNVWVNFGPFDITSFVVQGENTIVFQSPPPGHFGLVKNILITQGDTVLLQVNGSRAVSASRSPTFTFSNPPLVVTSYTVNPTMVVKDATVTFTATFTGGSGPFTCSFTFGDGTPAVVVTTSSGTCSATHSYDDSGNFLARVKIIGQASTDIVRVFLGVTVLENDGQSGPPADCSR